LSKFIELERQRLNHYKVASPHLSEAARADGIYLGKPRSFCLPRAQAAENLYLGIREQAIEAFRASGIPWHSGRDGNPSNHLCSSQVCCVNFLYPFSSSPAELLKLLAPLFPGIRTMLSMERGDYVVFEWIGAKDYLGERPKSKRTRGANSTSADAALMFERADGRRQIVLIEWKYTESYARHFKRYAPSGTDRGAIYAPVYQRDDCWLDKALLPSYDALFYEPFYQFLRQQLLAQEMEKAHELGADVVSLLHIAPACNTDFQRVTSPTLVDLGASVTEIWSRLVRVPERFASVSVESLFNAYATKMASEMMPWWQYVCDRYAWLRADPETAAS